VVWLWRNTVADHAGKQLHTLLHVGLRRVAQRDDAAQLRRHVAEHPFHVRRANGSARRQEALLLGVDDVVHGDREACRHALALGLGQRDAARQAAGADLRRQAADAEDLGLARGERLPVGLQVLLDVVEGGERLANKKKKNRS
jgi:hypothetical protein